MVYCGKPSKGCAPCRAKRTKCDQARPYCGQCRRAHRDCPGYRDLQDTVFRNETSKVVTKAKAGAFWKRSKDTSPIDDIEVATCFSGALTQSVDLTAVAIRSLSVPQKDQATCYFFRNFAPDDPSPQTMYSSVLPNLYRQDSKFSALPKIVDAIGLAGISNLKHAPALMVTASQMHARVLRAITASIQDSKEASSDETLIVVVLLGLFETMTCSNPESMRSWVNHITGATAIARLRGTDQLRTNTGRKIFAIVRLQILIDCLQRRQIVPPDIIELAEIEAEAESKGTQFEPQLFLVIGRLCALRATVEKSQSSDIGVVTLANLIDSDLEDWKNSLPSALSYSIVRCANTGDVFSDTYHVYNDTWKVTVWNVYRCARILNQQVITDWLRHNSMPSPGVDEPQRHLSQALLANLAYDICASVPFLLGASHSSLRSSWPAKAAAGLALLWPLYLAATLDQPIDGMRAWVITRLEFIGQTTGIRQAESLVDVLSTKREITAWDKFKTARADEVIDDW